MINTFKGLVGDNNIIDLISSYSFPHDPQSQQDNGSIFIQPPMDLYNSVADDLQSGLLLTQLNQDRSKTSSSPKKDYHLGKKVQAGPKGSLLGPRTDQDLLDDDDDDDEDGDKEGDEDGSDDDDKKRGKYRTYTDEEKAHIIKFMMKHGIQQTLEIFSGGEHKITKRKLKSWLESQNKIKGVKGRKSNDPARDRALNEWCMDFQNEHGRPPSRKEATQKALELSGDPNFQASKGWLDKFSRKYNIEFTPLKIIPPRGKKKVKTNGESIIGEPVSAASTQASGLIESLSPLKEAKVKISDLDAKKMVSPAAIAKDVKQPDGSNFMRVNPAFNKPMYQQPPQQMPQHQHQQHQHQHQHQHQQQHQHQHQHQQQNAMPVQPQTQMPQQQQQQQGQQYPPMPANDGSYPSMDGGVYSAISNLDGQQGQGFGYPFNYPSLDYSMPYGLNYPKMYPRKSYPMNYPMNLPMNYPNFAENLQLLQQMMMKKESDIGLEKTQFS